MQNQPRQMKEEYNLMDVLECSVCSKMFNLTDHQAYYYKYCGCLICPETNKIIEETTVETVCRNHSNNGSKDILKNYDLEKMIKNFIYSLSPLKMMSFLIDSITNYKARCDTHNRKNIFIDYATGVFSCNDCETQETETVIELEQFFFLKSCCYRNVKDEYKEIIITTKAFDTIIDDYIQFVDRLGNKQASITKFLQQYFKQHNIGKEIAQRKVKLINNIFKHFKGKFKSLLIRFECFKAELEKNIRKAEENNQKCEKGRQNIYEGKENDIDFLIIKPKDYFKESISCLREEINGLNNYETIIMDKLSKVISISFNDDDKIHEDIREEIRLR